MGLSIRVDDRQTCYNPGDTVKGCVQFGSSKDEKIQSVVIDFQCTSEVVFPDGSHYPCRATTTIFSFTQQLHRVGDALPTARRFDHSWPFEFCFPTESDTISVPVLPPTFMVNVSNSTVDVRYNLKAVLTRASLRLFSLLSTSVNHALTFSPFRYGRNYTFEMQKATTSFLARSMHLLPGKCDTELTTREQLRTVFHKTTLPQALFEFSLKHPRQIVKGGSFPFMVKLDLLRTKPAQLGRTPLIGITSLKVEVKTMLAVNAKGHQDVITTKQVLLNIKRNEYSEMLPLPEDLQDEYFDLSYLGVMTHRLPRDFETPNITVTNEVKFTMRVYCEDEGWDWECKSDPRILAADVGRVPHLPFLLQDERPVQHRDRPRYSLDGVQDPPPPYVEPPAYEEEA
ncbi:hypothetical protein EJ08DRAFT_665592 [Tothia fuscella]|uniref:Arrestin-like N-terminal domain-containing protein n=1 Tax=Tothia fuscella TaxID=1048955 RepID=A0A9P4NGM1_9PEZI|nr:hypothetical protein EJ08DRAFT_665592 [Tothia fuscella]